MSIREAVHVARMHALESFLGTHAADLISVRGLLLFTIHWEAVTVILQNGATRSEHRHVLVGAWCQSPLVEHRQRMVWKQNHFIWTLSLDIGSYSMITKGLDKGRWRLWLGKLQAAGWWLLKQCNNLLLAFPCRLWQHPQFWGGRWGDSCWLTSAASSYLEWKLWCTSMSILQNLWYPVAWNFNVMSGVRFAKPSCATKLMAPPPPCWPPADCLIS